MPPFQAGRVHEALMRAAAPLLLLLLLASAAQAHWVDVRFRDLTVIPEGESDYRFSVLLVNTEGTTNGNNVSFDLGGPMRSEKLCLQYVSLPAFEKRTLECKANVAGPGRYVLVFQSERIEFDAGGGGLAPRQPPPSTPTPAPRSPGFEAIGAAAALAGALVALRRRGP